MKKVLFGLLALSLHGTAIANCNIYDHVITTDEVLRENFVVGNPEVRTYRTVNRFGEELETRTKVLNADSPRKQYNSISFFKDILDEKGLSLTTQNDQADFMILLDVETQRNLGFYFGADVQEYSNELVLKVIKKGTYKTQTYEIKKSSNGFDEGLKKSVGRILKDLKSCKTR